MTTCSWDIRYRFEISIPMGDITNGQLSSGLLDSPWGVEGAFSIDMWLVTEYLSRVLLSTTHHKKYVLRLRINCRWMDDVWLCCDGDILGNSLINSPPAGRS